MLDRGVRKRVRSRRSGAHLRSRKRGGDARRHVEELWRRELAFEHVAGAAAGEDVFHIVRTVRIDAVDSDARVAGTPTVRAGGRHDPVELLASQKKGDASLVGGIDVLSKWHRTRVENVAAEPVFVVVSEGDNTLGLPCGRRCDALFQSFRGRATDDEAERDEFLGRNPFLQEGHNVFAAGSKFVFRQPSFRHVAREASRDDVRVAVDVPRVDAIDAGDGVLERTTAVVAVRGREALLDFRVRQLPVDAPFLGPSEGIVFANAERVASPLYGSEMEQVIVRKMANASVMAFSTGDTLGEVEVFDRVERHVLLWNGMRSMTAPQKTGLERFLLSEFLVIVVFHLQLL